MTLPDERYRAVVQTRRFLLDLCISDHTPRVPKLIRQTAAKEQSRDESDLSKRELQELIDTALDEGDYEEEW